jgi:HEAT repeat protein
VVDPDGHVSIFAPLLLSLGLALAGATDDLRMASDASLDEATRMAAFQRLVNNGAMDVNAVVAAAEDPEGDSRQRWVAVRALGEIGGDRCKQVLVGLVADPQPAMRAAAAGGLGDLGGKDSVPQLTALLADPAVIVRAAAAEALGKIGSKDAVPALVAALESRDNYHRGSSLWVRRHYVLALGNIGDKAAVSSLLRGLDDGDPGVAEASILAFEQIGGFTMKEGRDAREEKEAWRRWAAAQLRQGG